MKVPSRAVTVRWGRVFPLYLGFGAALGVILGGVVWVFEISEEWRTWIMGAAIGAGTVGFTIAVNRLLARGSLRWLSGSREEDEGKP